ncbi:MAG TPA: hypothetical protein VMV41_17215 [Cellulomonadaceae bacterium]|nr:hypothetical protein [Cellulomonadaceae bacterium]
MGADGAAWRANRRTTASAHQAALERRRAADADRARGLLADFVRESRELGPAPVQLRVRSNDGRHRYRTDLTGWYLRQNESVAVGTDGEFYVLSVPPSVAAWFRGATLTPSDPPLVLGAGGRDGESIDLSAALDRVRARRGGSPGQTP